MSYSSLTTLICVLILCFSYVLAAYALWVFWLLVRFAYKLVVIPATSLISLLYVYFLLAM